MNRVKNLDDAKLIAESKCALVVINGLIEPSSPLQATGRLRHEAIERTLTPERVKQYLRVLEEYSPKEAQALREAYSRLRQLANFPEVKL